MINFLARRSLLSVDISGAALFRSITKWQPTLIVDEADDVLVDNADLRSVINSGWTRGQGTIRCHPDTHEPELFSTFAPKVVAMKGRNLPDTTLSRSIIITMRPRRADDPEEHAADFDHLDNETFARLRSQAMRWAADNGERIAKATPEIPVRLPQPAAGQLEAAAGDRRGLRWRLENGGLEGGAGNRGGGGHFRPLDRCGTAVGDQGRLQSHGSDHVSRPDQRSHRRRDGTRGRPTTRANRSRSGRLPTCSSHTGSSPRRSGLATAAPPEATCWRCSRTPSIASVPPVPAPHPRILSATSATDLFSQDFSRFLSATGSDDVADRKDEKPFDNNDVADVADENGGPGDAGRSAPIAASLAVTR